MSSTVRTVPFSVANPDEGSLRFYRTRDLGLIIRVTVRLIQDQFAEIAAGVGLIAGPAYMLVAAFGAFVDPSDVGQQVALSLLGVLPALLLTASVVAYIRLYRSGYEGQVSVSDIWEEAKPLILPTLGYQWLVGLGFGLTAAIAIGVGSVGGAAGFGLAAIAVIGLILWALPIILVGMMVRLLEEESTIDSFRRGMELVAARRAMAYGTTAVVFMLTVFVVVVVAGAFGAVIGFSGDPQNPSPLIIGLTSAVTYLFGMVASVVYTIAAAFLHGSLVDYLEGASLMEEIDGLGAVPVSEESEVDTLSIRDRARAEPLSADASAPAAPTDSEQADAKPSGFRGGGFDPPTA